MGYGKRCAVILLASLPAFLSTSATAGGGKSASCDMRLHDELAPGEYEVDVVAADHSALIGEVVSRVATEIRQDQPELFRHADLKFVTASTINSVPAPTPEIPDRPRYRAYIILSDERPSAIAKRVGPLDVLTVIPPISMNEIALARSVDPISEREYYERMALHSTLRTLLYWDQTHHERVSAISFEHMLTDPRAGS